MTARLLAITPQPTQRSRPVTPHLHHRQVRVIETPSELPRPTQLTDPAFNASPKTSCGAKPALFFIPAAPSRLVARLGQTDALDAQSARLLFVVRRMQPSITAQVTRRLAECAAMIAHTRQDLALVRRVAVQDAPLGHNSAVHFREPELATKLGFLGFDFAAANDGCGRLE